jgi:hypothetical protein
METIKPTKEDTKKYEDIKRKVKKDTGAKTAKKDAKDLISAKTKPVDPDIEAKSDHERTPVEHDLETAVDPDSETAVEVEAGATEDTKEHKKRETFTEKIVNVIKLLQQGTNELTDDKVKEIYKNNKHAFPKNFLAKWDSDDTSVKVKRFRTSYVIFQHYYYLYVKDTLTEDPLLKDKEVNELKKIFDITKKYPKDKTLDEIKKSGKKVTSGTYIAFLWQHVNKDKFIELSERDKAHYISEMTKLDPNYTTNGKRSGSADKRKNSKSLFKEEFIEDLGPDHEEMDSKDLNKLVNDKWATLSTTEKNEYAQRAKEYNEGHEFSSPDKLDPSKLSESERNKYNNPDKYIYNPHTKRFVERSSKIGKELVKNLEK